MGVARGGWWIWCGFSLVTALTCLRINVVYTRKLERGEKPWGHEFVRPITFTLSSALLGGSQMIVQSKVFSELLGMLFQGDYTPWLSWLAYVALVMVVACGILWVVKPHSVPRHLQPSTHPTADGSHLHPLRRHCGRNLLSGV